MRAPIGDAAYAMTGPPRRSRAVVAGLSLLIAVESILLVAGILMVIAGVRRHDRTDTGLDGLAGTSAATPSLPAGTEPFPGDRAIPAMPTRTSTGAPASRRGTPADAAVAVVVPSTTTAAIASATPSGSPTASPTPSPRQSASPSVGPSGSASPSA